MEEYSNATHMGFIRAPQSTYVPDLASLQGGKCLYNYGANAWCCDTYLNATALYHYSNNKAFTTLNSTKVVPGDRFGFKFNFKDKTCEILHNGKNFGVVFKDLPSEISPAVSSCNSPHKGKIRFVSGRRV